VLEPIPEKNAYERVLICSRASQRRSSADNYTSQSRNYRKSKNQYGKIHFIPRPTMTAYKEAFAVPADNNQIYSKRKEAQILEDLDNKQDLDTGLGQRLGDLGLRLGPPI
jgi:hypothetical protein